jgi:hypothetical protein
LEQLEQRVYCTKCKHDTKHNIVNTLKRGTQPGDEVQWLREYHITECAGCETVAFVDIYGDEDLWDYNEHGHLEYSYDVEVYPPKPQVEPAVYFAHINPEVYRHVPESIYSLYKQVVNSFNTGHLLLATIGLRTLIEAICIDTNVKKGYRYDVDQNILPDKDGVEKKTDTVEGKINGLYEKDLIIWDHSLVLQRIRKISNSAVHKAVEPSIPDFKNAVKIVEHLLENVYELKNHNFIQQLREEKEQKEQKEQNEQVETDGTKDNDENLHE